MNTTNKLDLLDICSIDLIIRKYTFSSSTNGIFTESNIKQVSTFYRNTIQVTFAKHKIVTKRKTKVPVFGNQIKTSENGSKKIS